MISNACGSKFSPLDVDCSGTKRPTALENSSEASGILRRLFAGDLNSIYPYGVDPVFLP